MENLSSDTCTSERPVVAFQMVAPHRTRDPSRSMGRGQAVSASAGGLNEQTFVLPGMSHTVTDTDRRVSRVSAMPTLPPSNVNSRLLSGLKTPWVLWCGLSRLGNGPRDHVLHQIPDLDGLPARSILKERTEPRPGPNWKTRQLWRGKANGGRPDPSSSICQ